MDDAPASTRSYELVRIHRNRWILGLAGSPLLLSLAAIVAGILTKPVFFAFTLHPALLGVFALFYAWRRNPWPVLEEVPVRADANGVQVGLTHVPRADLQGGFVLPGDAPRVKLRRRFGLPIELQAGTTHEARSLLRALGLDVSQTVASFRTLSRAVAKRRYIASFIATFFLIYGSFITGVLSVRPGPTPLAVAGVTAMLAILGMVTAMVMPTKLSVGADGIVLRWFFRDRFIGYGDIESVDRYARGWGRSQQIGLTVTLRSGDKVPIPTGQATWGTEGLAIIEERIRQGMESFRSGDAASDAALLRRGARDVGAWISALKSIGAGANAGMRTAPLPRERLLRIVESPAASVTDRAAAAVAIGGEIDDDARTRLRVAAEAIASPKLRVVLEAAASGAAEAELEAALAEAARDDEAKA